MILNKNLIPKIIKTKDKRIYINKNKISYFICLF